MMLSPFHQSILIVPIHIFSKKTVADFLLTLLFFSLVIYTNIRLLKSSVWNHYFGLSFEDKINTDICVQLIKTYERLSQQEDFSYRWCGVSRVSFM